MKTVCLRNGEHLHAIELVLKPASDLSGRVKELTKN